MERPKLVWVVGVLGALGLLSELISLFSGKVSGTFGIIYFVLFLIGTAWVYSFFQLKTYAKKMLHLVTVLWAVYLLVGTFFDMMNNTHNVVPKGQIEVVFAFVGLLFIFMFWNIFRIYINKRADKFVN